ncbi:hypothetical protein [Pandoraea sp. B-6]|uniref:hypothetical protein n=1 Tax=Pandoraea sp. B-6 TaxID=1204340 RepID=UPI0012FB283A|nr:hypothetical protein [Pandoraea sp. B-6]
MGLSREDAVTMVEQLQQAHRISVAFYRRILPTLDNIASELKCQFRYWEPLHTSMPGRATTRPSTKWAWDYVPLFAFNQVYWRTGGTEAQPSDVGLSLCTYVDDGFNLDNRKKSGVTGQPDAVTLPIGNAVLQAYIFRPTEASTRPFSELWKETEDPSGDSGQIEVVGEHMQAIWFEWALADVLVDTRPIVETLKIHVE